MLENEHIANIPETWEELTTQQYHELVSLILLEYSPQQIQHWMAIYCMGFDMKEVTRETLANERAASNVDRVAKLIRFLDPELFKMDCCKNLAPVVKIGRKQFYGPADHLTDVSLGEFIDALDAFDQVCTADSEQEKEKASTRLMAILYRSSHKGKKLAYDQDTLENRVAMFEKKAKLTQIFGAVFFFSACVEHIQKSPRYEMIWERKKEEDDENGDEKEGFGSVLFMLAGTKFGDFDKTATTNLYTVLEELRNKKRETDELKKKYGNTAE